MALIAHSISKDTSRIRLALSSEFGNVFYLPSYDRSFRYKYSYSSEFDFGLQYLVNKEKKAAINFICGLGYLYFNRKDADLQGSGLKKVYPDGPYRYVGLTYSYFCGSVEYEKKRKSKASYQIGASFRYYFLKKKIGDYNHETLYYTKNGISSISYSAINLDRNSEFFTFFVLSGVSYTFNKNWELGVRTYVQLFEPIDYALSEKNINVNQWRNNSVNILNMSYHPLAIFSFKLKYFLK